MSDKKPGRPPTPIDYEQIEKMAMMQFTDYEMAAWIGFTDEGFRKRKKADDELVGAIEKGRAKGKSSLRRMQYKAAESGNNTMLVWLGKQYLDQTDKRDINQTGDVIIEIHKPEGWDDDERDENERGD